MPCYDIDAVLFQSGCGKTPSVTHITPLFRQNATGVHHYLSLTSPFDGTVHERHS
jgi:hypothetical protein